MAKKADKRYNVERMMPGCCHRDDSRMAANATRGVFEIQYDTREEHEDIMAASRTAKVW